MVINNNLWRSEPIICLTLDTDWASEDALKKSYSIIEEYGFDSTFFITHKSNYLLKLYNKGKIDAGIHPNFLKNSSHGKSVNEVIDNCLNILPETKSFRCHNYYDSNEITDLLFSRGLLYDSNLCTLLQKVEPFVHRSGLIRFPIFLEDGAYLLHNKNLVFKDIRDVLFNDNGLMIINIHPMHLVLNTPTFNYMRKIKENLSREDWNKLTDADLDYLSYDGIGIRYFIIELFNFIKKEKIKVMNLHNVYESVIN
ncbi:MAG: hypothetical protein RIN55_04300 [Tissierellaceae bacterium]|nr:hypothetical protein [Tissierellaceae bacterium]